MIKENNMIILNSLEKCRGKWTRSSGREKSIIDYIMIGEEDENVVESIIIDDKKEKSPYRMRRSDGITHQIFSLSQFNDFSNELGTRRRKLKQL